MTAIGNFLFSFSMHVYADLKFYLFQPSIGGNNVCQVVIGEFIVDLFRVFRLYSRITTTLCNNRLRFIYVITDTA